MREGSSLIFSYLRYFGVVMVLYLLGNLTFSSRELILLRCFKFTYFMISLLWLLQLLLLLLLSRCWVDAVTVIFILD